MNSHELNVWYTKIGWTKNPFILDIQPSLMVGHKNEIDRLLKNIKESQKYILILGPTGAGKTTLLKHISEKYSPVYLPKPPKHHDELVSIFKTTILKPTILEKILKNENITIYNLAEKTNRKHKGKSILFLVDEAHETDIGVLEWLRTITDQIDGATLILAGLPVFKETHLAKLETLKQRITLEIELRTLNKDETIELIRKRIESAGGHNLDPFTYDTINEIYKKTGGFPREVIKQCNHLIHQAIERNSQIVDSTYFKDKNEIDTIIDVKETLSTLTEKQAEIVEILSKTDGITPTELLGRLNISEYKSKMHALRAVNNILRRLETSNMVIREKRGRAYKYMVSAKLKNVLINA
ncbi:MAG: AAA family ATPase [archaeon]